jgi:hypothetical protein
VIFPVPVCDCDCDCGVCVCITDLAETLLDDDRTLELVGIRTDCIKLPFSIEVTTGQSEEWQVCVSGALGPFVEVPPTRVTGVRLVWRCTDMHMMDGLSSARAGGGLHAEVIGAIASPGARPLPPRGQ